MKRGSFDARVAKCIAKFNQVETRSNERGERLGLDTRAPSDPDDTPPRRVRA